MKEFVYSAKMVSGMNEPDMSLTERGIMPLAPLLVDTWLYKFIIIISAALFPLKTPPTF